MAESPASAGADSFAKEGAPARREREKQKKSRKTRKRGREGKRREEWEKGPKDKVDEELVSDPIPLSLAAKCPGLREPAAPKSWPSTATGSARPTPGLGHEPVGDKDNWKEHPRSMSNTAPATCPASPCWPPALLPRRRPSAPRTFGGKHARSPSRRCAYTEKHADLQRCRGHHCIGEDDAPIETK